MTSIYFEDTMHFAEGLRKPSDSEITAPKMNDLQLAKMVDELTHVAEEYSTHGSLRVRLGNVVKEYLK
jgi:hypothetical protein